MGSERVPVGIATAALESRLAEAFKAALPEGVSVRVIEMIVAPETFSRAKKVVLILEVLPTGP